MDDFQTISVASLAATVSRGIDAEPSSDEQVIRDAKESLSELVERCKWLSELTGHSLK